MPIPPVGHVRFELDFMPPDVHWCSSFGGGGIGGRLGRGSGTGTGLWISTARIIGWDGGRGRLIVLMNDDPE